MKEVFKTAWKWVKLGTHQEVTPVTQQIPLKRFWELGLTDWLSMRAGLQKLWLLLQMGLRLARHLGALKSLEKMLESLSSAIWSPFAEMLNYELCLWLANILILLRFKILALSPNPTSSKIFLYFSVVGTGLDPGCVVGPCTSHLTHCFYFLLCFYERSFHNFQLCQKSSSNFRSYQSHAFLLALHKTKAFK